jgi:autotransporter-associated beta strand protein
LHTDPIPAITVDNHTVSYTITGSGGIAGGLSLVKNGAGRLNFHTVNTFTGHVTINGGTLAVTGSGRLYHGSANTTAVVTVNPGATLEAAAGADWMIHTFADSQPVRFNGNPTLVLDGAGNGHFWKQVTGLHSVVKRGTGLWSIMPEDGSGNVAVEQGVLRLKRAVLADNSTVEIRRGGILDLWHGDTDLVGTLIIDGAAMPPGTYSRSTHPSFIIGTGRLSVGGSASTGANRLTVTYHNYDKWPSSKQYWIKCSMEAVLHHYNRYGTTGRIAGNIRVDYNANVPTAQASFGGPITFGQTVGTWVGFHEMSHAMGTGTAGAWLLGNCFPGEGR